MLAAILTAVADASKGRVAMLPRQRYLPLLHIPAVKAPLRQRYLLFLHIPANKAPRRQRYLPFLHIPAVKAPYGSVISWLCIFLPIRRVGGRVIGGNRIIWELRCRKEGSEEGEVPEGGVDARRGRRRAVRDDASIQHVPSEWSSAIRWCRSPFDAYRWALACRFFVRYVIRM